MSFTTPVRLRTALAAGALAAGLVAAPSPVTPLASAASGFERGPDPTSTSIEATRGSFAVSQYSVSDLASRGFGSGTVYYPTSTAQGRFGVVAISPGYTAGESSIQWLGPRLASFGFVVITFNTNSRYDQPGSRADQLAAALDYLTENSTVRSRVGLLTDKLTGRTRFVFEIFALTMAAVILGFFSWHVVSMTYTSWLINDMSTGVLVIPLWIPQTGFTAGLVILFIAVLDELVHVLAGNKPRYEKEPPKTAEEAIERAAASGV